LNIAKTIGTDYDAGVKDNFIPDGAPIFDENISNGSRNCLPIRTPSPILAPARISVPSPISECSPTQTYAPMNTFRTDLSILGDDRGFVDLWFPLFGRMKKGSDTRKCELRRFDGNDRKRISRFDV
jgi:hypothetical protein